MEMQPFDEIASGFQLPDYAQSAYPGAGTDDFLFDNTDLYGEYSGSSTGTTSPSGPKSPKSKTDWARLLNAARQFAQLAKNQPSVEQTPILKSPLNASRGGTGYRSTPFAQYAAPLTNLFGVC